MGCAGSVPANGDRGGPVLTGNSSNHVNGGGKENYHSDVGNEGSALVSRLTRKSSAKDFTRQYDMSEATELGHGACGSVIAVRRRDTGEMYAMKTISLDSMGVDTFEELNLEMDIQKKLDHPNICKIVESFEDKRRGIMYIVMELCTGGSLVSRIKSHRNGFGERAAATLMEKMLSAIIYCHRHGVVHRDIKLDNMIYEHDGEDAELKLIDFGFAQKVRRGREGMWDQLGTPSYMAPELWSDVEVEYDSSVDTWALGVVTYMLLSGRRPFDHPNKNVKKRIICEDELQFPSPHWDRISADAKDFCHRMMRKRPGDRMSAAEAAKHPWIKKNSLHRASSGGISAALEMKAHNEIVQSLEAFSAADGMAKLALQVIAFTTPPQKLEELRQLFQKMDEDDSGTISIDEFRKAFDEHPDIPSKRIQEMFDQMDVDGSGSVDYTEFLAATLASSKQFNENSSSILAAFNLLDTDHNGYINEADLQAAFDNKLDSKMVGLILKNADDSGLVDFDAFKRSLLNLLTDSKTFDKTTTILEKVKNTSEASFTKPKPKETD